MGGQGDKEGAGCEEGRIPRGDCCQGRLCLQRNNDAETSSSKHRRKRADILKTKALCTRGRRWGRGL